MSYSKSNQRETVEPQVLNYGSYGNIQNGGTLANGAFTSSIDISNFGSSSVFVEDSTTGSFDNYQIWTSANNSNFHYASSLMATEALADGSRRGSTTINLSGLTHLKVKNGSANDTYSDVQLSVYGGNN